MKEIIIELGILDKIRSITDKAYNPFRDALGRFSSSSESKNTDNSLLNRIKSRIDKLTTKEVNIDNIATNILFSKSDSFGFSKDELLKIGKNVEGIITEMSESIEGIDLNTPVKLFASNSDWKKELGISSDMLGLAGSYGGLYKDGKIMISPLITQFLSERSIDDMKYEPNFLDRILETDKVSSLSSILGLDNKQFLDDDIRLSSVKKVLVHELFHTRDRLDNSKLDPDDVMNNITNYDLEREEGSTELLSQLYSYKSLADNDKLKKAKEIFIRNYGGSYKKEVFSILSDARSKFPNSPSEALKYINDNHKKGFSKSQMGDSWEDGKFTSKFSSFTAALFPEADREWLINGLDDIKLNNLNYNIINLSSKLESSKLESSKLKNNKLNSKIGISDIQELINDKNWKELSNILVSNYEVKKIFAYLIMLYKDKDTIIENIEICIEEVL